MKIKQLGWINPQPNKIMTDDSIPQILYRLHLSWDYTVDARTYEVRFQHGYDNDYDNNIIYRGPDIEECKKHAQIHWEQYARKSFLEE